MKGIIIVLGARNDENGKLTSIARERSVHAVSEYRQHPDYYILPTGGFGNHFNNTQKAHAHYTKQFLISQGIPESHILEFAKSTNTIEDAKLAKPIVDKYGVKQLIVVTSDFHAQRAKIIFEKEFSGYSLKFSSSTTDLSGKQLEKVKLHEKQSIILLKQRSEFN